MRQLIVISLALVCAWSQAQPYLDLVNAGWYTSPERFDKYDLNINIPLSIGKGGDKLVVSPWGERWNVTVPGAEGDTACNRLDALLGVGLATTWVHVIVPDRWKMVITGIARWNQINPERGEVQPGGAVLVNRDIRQELTLKIGAYANGDAFGLFMLPLIGIDWRISGKHNLFGVLPGSLTYEHKPLAWLHWGAAFKAITTSFGLRSGDFRRVDENSIGLFLDLYPDRLLALRLEGGHTALSQYQGGALDPCHSRYGEGKYVDHHIGDGLYLKLMLAFRVRLDEEKATPGEKTGR